MSGLHEYETDGCPAIIAGNDDCLHYSGYENYERLVNRAIGNLKDVGKDYIAESSEDVIIPDTSAIQSRIKYISIIESFLKDNSPQMNYQRVLYNSLLKSMTEDEAKDFVDDRCRQELAKYAYDFLIYHNYSPLSVFELEGLEPIFPPTPPSETFLIDSLWFFFSDRINSEDRVFNIREEMSQREAALALLLEYYFQGEIYQWDYYDPSGLDPLIYSHYTWKSTDGLLEIDCFKQVQAARENKSTDKVVNNYREGLEEVVTTMNKEYLLGIPSIRSAYVEAQRNLMSTEWERTVRGHRQDVEA